MDRIDYIIKIDELIENAKRELNDVEFKRMLKGLKKMVEIQMNNQ